MRFKIGDKVRLEFEITDIDTTATPYCASIGDYRYWFNQETINEHAELVPPEPEEVEPKYPIGTMVCMVNDDLPGEVVAYKTDTAYAVLFPYKAYPHYYLEQSLYLAPKPEYAFGDKVMDKDGDTGVIISFNPRKNTYTVAWETGMQKRGYTVGVLKRMEQSHD